MVRFISIFLILLTITPSVLGQRAPVERNDFVVILVIDAEEPLKQRISQALLREFRALKRADVHLFEEQWQRQPNWVVSISASTVSSDDGESIIMATAYSESVNLVDEASLDPLVRRYAAIPRDKLTSQLRQSRRGVSDFRGMWLTHARNETELVARCREAARVFDENFLSPERMRAELLERERQNRNRRRPF